MNNATNITCPNCGTHIHIEELLEQDIENRIKADYALKFDQERAKIAQSAKADAEAILKTQITALQAENEARTEQLRILQRTAIEHQQLQLELRDLRESQDLLLEQRLLQEREKLLADARAREQQRFEQAELLALQRHNEEKALQQSIFQSELLKLQSQAQLRERDLQKQLEDTRKAAEEFERKSKQSSQQLQGETLELEVEEYLKQQFVYDRIEAIGKGQSGADCLHIVQRFNQKCGSIYYETKRTKAFSNEWISKLKADIRDKGADVGVIVTETMPKDMVRFGMKDGIWICSFTEFKALCFVLRELVIRVSDAQSAQQNKGDKMALLYDFLTSNEFRAHIEGVLDTFVAMKSDLEKEQRSLQLAWARRDKQLQVVLSSVTSLVGSINGIATNTIAPISHLELPE